MSNLHAIKTLISLAERHDNLDSTNFDQAVTTIVHGRPAYWTSAKYHSAIIWGFVYAANAANLEQAVSELPDRSKSNIKNWLGFIYPLNPQAKVELGTLIERVSKAEAN